MTGRLDGKVALITGSDSGIGQGTAVEFAREGADVVAHYLEDEAGANSTRQQIEAVGRLKINVNNIAPGMVLTPFNQKAIDDPKYLEQQVQSIPLKRAAEPWEIGRLAVFLASSDADYVTGSTYVMDGGLMQNQGQGA